MENQSQVQNGKCKNGEVWTRISPIVGMPRATVSYFTSEDVMADVIRYEIDLIQIPA